MVTTGKLVDQYGAALKRSAYIESSSTGSYEIVRDKGRRRNPRTGKSAEHINYNQRARDKAQGTIYDLIRNDVVAQWAYNKFLDYTTVHYFQSSTGDPALDDDIEYAVENWSMAQECDLAKRHGLSDMIRLFASGIALDGDCALLLTDKLSLQGIEGDNIRNIDTKVDANNAPEETRNAVQGIITDEYTAALKYVICRKTNRPGRYIFRSVVDAQNLIFCGNFFRFDQIRGVPVMNAGNNTAQDIKEIDEYQLIKVKKHALFGVAIKSDAVNSGFNEAPLASGIAGSNSTAADTPQYAFEMDAGLKLELNPGDSIDMFESKTPSQEYREFSELMMRKFLLTWELPFEFFNPGNASYSTMKHVRSEFKFGIQRFEQRNRAVRYRILKWILPALLAKNDIKLPKKFAGEKIHRWLNWLPQAEPWLEEDREVNAAMARIDGGLSNLEDEAARRGKNSYDVLRGTRRVQEYIRKSKIVLVAGKPGSILWNPESMSTTPQAAAAPANTSSPSSATGGGSPALSEPSNPNENEDSND